jgi:hypothetical protein
VEKEDVTSRRASIDRSGRQLARQLLAVSPILAVAALLVGVYSLPTSVKRGFVFEYGAPTLLTAYTAHFVHFTPSHLAGNLAAFMLVTGTMYALSARADCRRIFLSFGATLFIAFPVALSALNLAVPRDGVTYGFSGMNMALAGFLPVVIATYVERRLGYPVDGVILLTAFFSSVGYIAAIALPWSTPSNAIAAVAVGVALAFTFRYGVSVRSGLSFTQRCLDRCGGKETLSIAGLGVWVVLLSMGFPETVVSDGAVTNIYIHFLGYALGFANAYLAYEWELIGGRTPAVASPN